MRAREARTRLGPRAPRYSQETEHTEDSEESVETQELGRHRLAPDLDPGHRGHRPECRRPRRPRRLWSLGHGRPGDTDQIRTWGSRDTRYSQETEHTEDSEESVETQELGRHRLGDTDQRMNECVPLCTRGQVDTRDGLCRSLVWRALFVSRTAERVTSESSQGEPLLAVRET